MSQINSDEHRKRAELLKIAKQLLIQDFDAMRGTNHQQWLHDSKVSWKTKGILIAYPNTKLFPTEQEVVAKALELYNNLNQPIANPSNTNVPNVSIGASLPIVSEVQPTAIVDPVSYYDAITPSITAQLQAAYNSPTSYSVIEPGEIIEAPAELSSSAELVQAGGDFVIIDEPIDLDIIDPIAEPIIEELITEEPNIDGTGPAKHSLLRSVLSGWLSKNKDKDTP